MASSRSGWTNGRRASSSIQARSERVAYIGWEVSDEASIDDLVRALAAAGAGPRRAKSEELRRAGRSVPWSQATDPAGHAVELFVASRPPPATPFRSPRPITGFRTGELGLGHIVVEVDVVPETVAFYTDVLGFRLSDRLAEALYFLRCNPRHHSIGIAHIGGPPADPSHHARGRQPRRRRLDARHLPRARHPAYRRSASTRTTG